MASLTKKVVSLTKKEYRSAVHFYRSLWNL